MKQKKQKPKSKREHTRLLPKHIPTYLTNQCLLTVPCHFYLLPIWDLTVVYPVELRPVIIQVLVIKRQQ